MAVTDGGDDRIFDADYGWWNRHPWTLDPDGALWTTVVNGPVGLVAWATFAGGPNGWDRLVGLELEMAAGLRKPAVAPSDYPRSKTRPPRGKADFVRVRPEHRPLRAWTREAIRTVTDDAYAWLARIDDQWRVGRALRQARVDPLGELDAPTVGTIGDETFADLYEIVTEKHSYGYAKVLGRMLSMEPQSVRNRVNQLRKQGLIEPANTRGNT